jgi:hypothetical protein
LKVMGFNQEKRSGEQDSGEDGEAETPLPAA